MTQDHITSKVNSHLRALDIRCPYCEALDIIGRPRFAVIPIIVVQRLSSRAAIPMVNIECTSCHILSQLSAGQLGLIKEPKHSNIKGNIQKDLARVKGSKN